MMKMTVAMTAPISKVMPTPPPTRLTMVAVAETCAATVPIIAVTANAFSEDIARTQQAGMNAHISKPIDFNVLEQVLGRLLAAPSNRQESEP